MCSLFIGFCFSLERFVRVPFESETQGRVFPALDFGQKVALLIVDFRWILLVFQGERPEKVPRELRNARPATGIQNPETRSS